MLWTNFFPILPEALAERLKNKQGQIIEPCKLSFYVFSQVFLRPYEVSGYMYSGDDADKPLSPWHYVVTSLYHQEVTLDSFKRFINRFSELPLEYGIINDYENILFFISKTIPSWHLDYLFNSKINYLLTYLLRHKDFAMPLDPLSIETFLMPMILLRQDITIAEIFLGKLINYMASSDVSLSLTPDFLKILTDYCSKPKLKENLLKFTEKTIQTPVNDNFISKYIELVYLELVNIYGQPEIYSNFGIDEQQTYCPFSYGEANPKKIAVMYALLLTEETKKRNIDLIVRVLINYFRPDKKEEVYNSWKLDHDQIEKILPRYERLLFKTYSGYNPEMVALKIEEFRNYYQTLITTDVSTPSGSNEIVHPRPLL